MEKVVTKAKRKLTDITFEHEGAHLALVHKAQGGAASGYKTLVMKSVDNRSPEFIQKASRIRVTLSLPDFLEKFFHIWEDDAEIIAAMFGYQDTEDDENEYDKESFWCWYRGKASDTGAVDSWGYPTSKPTDEDKKMWIQDQLKVIEILKSATLAKGSADFISGLTEEQYLSLLQDQEFIEKSFVKKDMSNDNGGGKPKQTEANIADTKENTMTQETIEKAQYDAKEVELQKALEEIQKAKEEIEAFKAKEKEAIEKAREQEVKAAVEDAEASAKLFKAVKDLEDEAFKDVVEVVKSLSQKVEDQALFKEQGSSDEGVQVQKSALQAMIDAKYKKA